MDLFRSHTQRAVEGSDLPCPSDCISGVLTQTILFIADQGAAGTEGRSLLSVPGGWGGALQSVCGWGQTHFCQSEDLL